MNRVVKFSLTIALALTSGCATTPTVPILMINFGEVHQSQEVHLWGKTYALEKEAEQAARVEIQTMLEEVKGIAPSQTKETIEDKIRKELGK